MPNNSAQLHSHTIAGSNLRLSSSSWLLSSSFTTQALSATTAKTIQGTAPYILSNGLKATDLSSLLSIKVGADTYVSDSAGNMFHLVAGGSPTPVTGGITLAAAGATFNSIGTRVTPDGSSITLDSIIPAIDRGDDDGDGTLTIKGNIKGVWQDKNNVVVTNLADPLTICNAPYKLTLTTSGTPEISSQYGDPRKTSYGVGNAIYTINPVSGSVICYAKPDMTYSTTGFAGPASMWNTTKGFLTQSASSVNYDKNFPTMGADGLYFDLDIAGAPNTYTWDPVTVGNVTATMSNISTNKIRVTLSGPKASGTGLVGSTAVPWDKGTGSFVIRGKSSGVTEVEYGFTLKHWFVASGLIYGGQANQAAWCNALSAGGYKLPKTYLLTNANGVANYVAGTYTIPVPPTPFPSTGNFERRVIGGGLYSEWGNTNFYAGAGKIQQVLRAATTDIQNLPNPWPTYVPYTNVVYPQDNGSIYGGQNNWQNNAVCVNS